LLERSAALSARPAHHRVGHRPGRRPHRGDLLPWPTATAHSPHSAVPTPAPAGAEWIDAYRHWRR
jgi:hypothetical protein